MRKPPDFARIAARCSRRGNKAEAAFPGCDVATLIATLRGCVELEVADALRQVYECGHAHAAAEVKRLRAALVDALDAMVVAQSDRQDLGGRGCAEATFFDAPIRKARRALRGGKRRA